MLSEFRLSSPSPLAYSTPSRSSYYSARSHQPMSSSPLASPTHEIQERRRAQYKSLSPISYPPLFTPASSKLFRPGSQTSEDPQKVFLRERLQVRCRQYAQKLRERALSSRRSSDRCSDVFMDCDDEEESDDAVMQDELFRRIVQSASHKKNHSYRVSYALEVGSSFDPDMEEISAWESALGGPNSNSAEPTPDELEEEELLEYAEQYTALADFADVQLATDDLTALSDVDDTLPNTPHRPSRRREVRQTSEMDVS